MTKRLECLELITQMPEDGLDECLSTLKEMLEFYTKEPLLLVPLVTAEKILRGRMLETVERPPLVIPPE